MALEEFFKTAKHNRLETLNYQAKNLLNHVSEISQRPFLQLAGYISKSELFRGRGTTPPLFLSDPTVSRRYIVLVWDWLLNTFITIFYDSHRHYEDSSSLHQDLSRLHQGFIKVLPYLHLRHVGAFQRFFKLLLLSNGFLVNIREKIECLFIKLFHLIFNFIISICYRGFLFSYVAFYSSYFVFTS